MKLSTQEKNYLVKLRKNLVTQRKMRWLFLVGGIVLMLIFLAPLIYSVIIGNFEFAGRVYDDPIFFVLIIAAGSSFSIAYKGFRGDTEKELFIKITEELAKNDS